MSFGERMSTRIFTSYLRKCGVPARQFDAPDIGFITSDDFGNADIIYDQTLSKVCFGGAKGDQTLNRKHNSGYVVTQLCI